MRQHETEPQLLKDYHAVDELCEEPRKSMASVIVIQGDASDGCLERRRAHKPEESKPTADKRSIHPFAESRGVGEIIKSRLERRCLDLVSDELVRLSEELLNDWMGELMMLLLETYLIGLVKLVSPILLWLAMRLLWHLLSRRLSAWRARGRR